MALSLQARIKPAVNLNDKVNLHRQIEKPNEHYNY